MNFQEIMIELKNGKKIRRAHWCKSYFLQKDWKGNIVEMNGDKNWRIKYQSTQGRDWEVYEEKLNVAHSIYKGRDFDKEREVIIKIPSFIY